MATLQYTLYSRHNIRAPTSRCTDVPYSPIGGNITVYRHALKSATLRCTVVYNSTMYSGGGDMTVYMYSRHNITVYSRALWAATCTVVHSRVQSPYTCNFVQYLFFNLSGLWRQYLGGWDEYSTPEQHRYCTAKQHGQLHASRVPPACTCSPVA